MSRLLTAFIAVPLISTAVQPAQADLLWDNGRLDGFNARAISPPTWPDIRVVDDFFVPAEGWQMEDMRFGILEDAGWWDGGLLEVNIRETDPDTGGPVTGEDADLVRLSTEYRREEVACYFGRCLYEYVVEDLDVEMEEGQYWLGIRNPDGQGAGTNYWMTSAAGGRDGAGTSTGYFSLDRAETWRNEGPDWQHAFEIGGTVLPEPGSLALLAGMGLLVLGRRRSGRGGGLRVLGLAIAGILALSVTTQRASADLLWDNDNIPDGRNARAVSPQQFPDIRVVDDFFVPDTGWRVEAFRSFVLEDAGWTPGQVIEVYLRANDPDLGGPVQGEDADLLNIVIEFERTRSDEGVCDWWGDCYNYDVPFGDDSFELDAGHYWIGFRNPNAGGSGTNYWVTSTGGPDGLGTSTGYFSLDRAETWMNEGPDWQHAFEIRGTPLPEPGSLALLAGMSLLVLGRRRSRGSGGPRLLGFALVGLLAMSATTPRAQADLLWDNGGPGGAGGRAISPPNFPDIRVVDDFFVPATGWRIEELQFRVYEDAGWYDDGSLEVYIRETDLDTGGPLPGDDANLIRFSTEYRKEKVQHYWGADLYEYYVEDLEIDLAEGQYWLGIRSPGGRGSGTSYWASSAGDRDAEGTRTGYFSLDRGETWMDEGPDWQHYFEIGGTPLPEPGTFALLAGMGLILIRRRQAQ